MRVLGLDASTTTVGWAIVESGDLSLVALGFWSLKKFDGLYAKADHVVHELGGLVDLYSVDASIWIEEAVMRFTPGMSSAQTISTLIGFNAMLSYGVHSKLNFDVAHVSPSEARRSCGLKLTTKAKAGGMGQKEQTFSLLTSPGGLLSSVAFPLTRTGKPKPENYDQADAYVVARHGALVARVT